MGEGGEKITCESEKKIAGAERWNEGDNRRRGAVMKSSEKPESRWPTSSAGPSRSVITSCHAISCSRRQKGTTNLCPPFFPLCLLPPQTSSRPSSDSEPRVEGESKVLSGSQPKINPVTSLRSCYALIFRMLRNDTSV